MTPKCPDAAIPRGATRTTGPDHQPALSLAPFRGLRYDGRRIDDIAAVISPPYDMVDAALLRELRATSPHNAVRLIAPDCDSVPAGECHRRAARTFRDWRHQGVLVPEPHPALYVYEQRRDVPGEDVLLQRGVIGALRLSPPEEGLVLPHEDVVPRTVEERAGLMSELGANPEPILLTYHGRGTAAQVIEEVVAERTPAVSARTAGGARHRLWPVTDTDAIAAISADLAASGPALIADGHHRWATYLALRSRHGTAAAPAPGHRPGDHGRTTPAPGFWDRGLAMLVDSDRYPLRLGAIHRVVPGLPPTEAVRRLTGAFRRLRPVSPDLPAAQRALAQAAAHGPALLVAGGPEGTAPTLATDPDEALLQARVRRDRPEPWRRLSATVLHDVVLERLWGVPDAPGRVHYVHQAGDALRRARRDGGTAVLLAPVREDLVRSLAAQGVTMPRKSTSFGPKPAVGLVMRALPEG
ncbi:DUF1015 family protein [Allostreptomyces psammosilenae]|uniref:Uncharacterized protein (DUF1015 family) n=1 Tax=Allostreptomyces psammosilenae TaxID=1892865 RepID=A0A852ZLS7_9ACTN|nr:DUF1015 domain-containing protein [Allostreptomyces psammosilenae]NYI03356.1 uncharacterized protein (DUF1015 family) [Allostreptomyces psammosilenae]